jgi:hypothetical protein
MIVTTQTVPLPIALYGEMMVVRYLLIAIILVIPLSINRCGE